MASGSDFDQRYPNARTGKGKPGWPVGVRSISQDGLDYLGLDQEGRLYWDGLRLKTETPLELTTSQGIGAWIVILSAFSLAIFDLLRFLGYGVH